MSSSTVFIRRPLNYRQSIALLTEKYKEYSPALSVILWMFSGLYAASHSKLNGHVSGMTLAFPVYNLLMIGLSSVLLYKGFKGNIFLVLPWIGVTIYTLYHQYLGLVNTLSTMKEVKNLPWLPWGHLTVNIILLIIRGTLTIQICQLCVHLWFKNKLKEMKGNRHLEK